jgi:hypothetical protein
LLPIVTQPLQMFVNWSRPAVERMKNLPGARFQNSSFYFRKGITYSGTGLYAPTFRISHGGVFDQKSPCIFSDVVDLKPLLGILSSTLIRYFTKVFINHGVDSQIQEIPIVLPTSEEVTALTAIVERVLEGKALSRTYDYRRDLEDLDSIVFDMYRLDAAERVEVKTWYVRRYPVLMGQADPESTF